MIQSKLCRVRLAGDTNILACFHNIHFAKQMQEKYNIHNLFVSQK